MPIVWLGAVSVSGLLELHIVPQDTTINAQYYPNSILQQVLLPVLARKWNCGLWLNRKYLTAVQKRYSCKTVPLLTWHSNGVLRSYLASYAKRNDHQTPLTLTWLRTAGYSWTVWSFQVHCRPPRSSSAVGLCRSGVRLNHQEPCTFYAWKTESCYQSQRGKYWLLNKFIILHI